MLKANAKVIATDMLGKRAEALQANHKDDKNFFFYPLDVCDEKQIEGIFQQIDQDGHKIDVVLNNAAITGEMLMNDGQSFPDFANTSLDMFERAIKTNLTGAFLIARQVDRDLIDKRPIHLINVASMYALNGPHHAIYQDMPFKSFSAYSASKAGIHGLTLWLAGYWAKRGGIVNTISPGAVENGHSDLFKSRVSKLIMLDRMAKPDEIADVMLFLVSKHANYMTGQMINVDGGFSGW